MYIYSEENRRMPEEIISVIIQQIKGYNAEERKWFTNSVKRTV